jgi:phosphoglycerate dehydrogenase-like enzyme
MVIFGAGSIGGEVARLASAIGMRVIAVRRSGGSVPGAQRVVTADKLESVAPEADYLVVAAPLTHATRGAVSRAVIGKLKPTAWVVNIARGPIIDEPALIEALQQGRIGGAALDTFVEEPLPPSSPLWGLPNVIMTPHTSNSSPRVRQRTLALFVENVRRFKAGEPLLNQVDWTAGY